MTQLLRRNPDSWLRLLPAACCSAGLLALAMPGRVGWWPLLFFALVPLLLTVIQARPGRSGLAGFVFGVVYNVALMYWILIVLGRYGGLSPWISVPALLLLSMYMALYPALFCWVLSRLAGRLHNSGRSLAPILWAAPVLWVGLEYLRSVLFSGFPWMDMGYGLFSQPELIQAADLGGHALLSFALVLCNTLIVVLIDRQYHRTRRVTFSERLCVLAGVIFLVYVHGYSMLQSRRIALVDSRAPHIRVAAVQGNIDQAEKWSPESKAATVERYLNLSRQADEAAPTQMLIWPETALPFYPQQEPALMERVADFTRNNSVALLTGSPLFRLVPSGKAKPDVQYFNGAMLFDSDGKVRGQHAKQHLVPFGEYVPFRRYLPFLAPLVVDIGEFSKGTEKGPLVLGSMRLGVLICYESIFPELAHATVIRGANLLVNISNDAWYGNSSAPYQSWAMAVFRAVENKRSLVRAANTGISGLVLPTGQVLAKSGLFTEAAPAAEVPLLAMTTFYNRYGYHFGQACAVGILGLLLLAFRVSRRQNAKA